MEPRTAPRRAGKRRTFPVGCSQWEAQLCCFQADLGALRVPVTGARIPPPAQTLPAPGAGCRGGPACHIHSIPGTDTTSSGNARPCKPARASTHTAHCAWFCAWRDGALGTFLSLKCHFFEIRFTCFPVVPMATETMVLVWF